jgi:hypothetical protein
MNWSGTAQVSGTVWIEMSDGSVLRGKIRDLTLDMHAEPMPETVFPNSYITAPRGVTIRGRLGDVYLLGETPFDNLPPDETPMELVYKENSDWLRQFAE